MQRPYVLAFVGEHDNGVLRWWTQNILDGFARHGLGHVLLDFTDPAWRDRLAECMTVRNPDLVFSFQGLAMDLRLGNQNFWTLNGIPFLSYLGDSPYHAPGLHAAEGPGLYLLYGCGDFLETYQRYLDGRAYAGILPYGYPPNPLASRTAWASRQHDAVFVKSGIDPASLRAPWAGLPPTVRQLVEDSAAQILSGADTTVADIVAEAFADRQIHWGDRRELFLYVCSTADRYARAVRAERMVRALLPHDVLVVGDWSHLDRPRARARFTGPIPAARLDPLYADSRIVLNTSPTVRYGIHERIMAGLLAKSAVLSDTTPFLAQTLHECPAFIGLDIDEPGFADALGEAFGNTLSDPTMPDKVAASFRLASTMFSFEDFLQRLLDHLSLERHRRTLEDWSFPPGHKPLPEAA